MATVARRPRSVKPTPAAAPTPACQDAHSGLPSCLDAWPENRGLWCTGCVRANPLPLAVPTFSADPDVEAAVDEARACLYPASENYRTNMRTLADQADRSAALRADLDAFRASTLEPLAPVDPWDRTYDSAADWPDDTDAFTWETTEAIEPEPTPAAFRPYEPTAAERLYVASAGAVNLFALPPLCGGAPDADARPIRLRTARRTNVGSCYRDEDQLRNHGCV